MPTPCGSAPVDDNRRLLESGARRLGLELDSAAVERLMGYFAELMRWSRRINLIARDTPEPLVVENHFLDSLTLAPLLGGVNVHLLDVGSGAGFPGLALACALPGVQFTLVEPRQKRVSFLGHIVRSLRLANVEVIADRIETHAREWQGRFSHITSRAVAEPGQFLPLIRPLVSPETFVLLMLARVEPLAGIDNLPSGGWQIVETRPLNLPFSGAPRLLAVVRPI